MIRKLHKWQVIYIKMNIVWSRHSNSTFNNAYKFQILNLTTLLYARRLNFGRRDSDSTIWREYMRRWGLTGSNNSSQCVPLLPPLSSSFTWNSTFKIFLRLIWSTTSINGVDTISHQTTVNNNQRSELKVKQKKLKFAGWTETINKILRRRKRSAYVWHDVLESVEHVRIGWQKHQKIPDLTWQHAGFRLQTELLL